MSTFFLDAHVSGDIKIVSIFNLGGSKLFKPVTKHDGHPLDHLDQAVVEAGGVPLEKQHDGVGVVDRARQGRHHLVH